MWLEGRRIAIVEDDPIMGESLVQSLTLEGAEIVWWKDGCQAIDGLRRLNPDLVICDIRLPDIDGETVFRSLARQQRIPPFLFATGHGNVEQAVSLIRAGAGDYICKPFEMTDFLARVNALIQKADEHASTGLLGVSNAMRRIEKLLDRLAIRSAPVLILGETGVGKEVCARYLHDHGRNPAGPFVAVNCAAIPSELMESELFGHEKGAFSGATALHKGYVERAKDGTLFLDEIGDMPLPMQAKLLRLFEDRHFTRVGGERTVPFQACLTCATNTQLDKAVAEGRFRQDLFYRINVMVVAIPPLVDRPDDIPWLLLQFFEQFRSDANVELKGFSSVAEQAAMEYRWPGNVRELRNRVERAILLSTGPWIMPSDLFPEMELPKGETQRTGSLRTARDEAERRQIARALYETGGQIIETARILDVSRTTLWDKMKRLGIVIPDGA